MMLISTRPVPRYIEPSARKAAFHLSQTLDEAHIDHHVMSEVPVGDLKKHLPRVADGRECISVHFKVNSVDSAKGHRRRIDPIVMLSAFDPYVARLTTEMFEIYCADARILCEAKQSSYYLCKRSIHPITVDLGVYDSFNDLQHIELNIPLISDALKHVAMLFIEREVQP